MTKITKFAGAAATAALLYGTTYLTTDRASPGWASAVGQASASVPTETRRTSTETEKLAASPRLPCASQAWPNISPDCIANANGAVREVRVIAAGEPQASEQRSVRSFRAAAPAPEPVKTAALPDPDSTGSLQKAAESVKAEAPAPKVATAVQKRVAVRQVAKVAPVRQERLATYASMPAQDFRPASAPAASAVIQDPIQFSLAERG